MRGRLCIFGEVLFDHFPDGTRVLGGAPFNVAWHLQAFGRRPRFISRVGRDPEGEAVREAMSAWGMDTAGLQTDPRRPTGRVGVRFDDGEPGYDIVHPCAYDAIDEPPQDSVGCALLYHGSLALRDAVSRQSAQALMTGKPETVFVDVNLRAPWWRRDRGPGHGAPSRLGQTQPRRVGPALPGHRKAPRPSSAITTCRDWSSPAVQKAPRCSLQTARGTR